jgi:catechol 2,3-dioxygenase-like lactoylglutathione lyase family enzyme
VPDYDTGIQFFTQTLGFKLVEDVDLGGGKRWVVVSGTDGGGADIVLAKAFDEKQVSPTRWLEVSKR